MSSAGADHESKKSEDTDQRVLRIMQGIRDETGEEIQKYSDQAGEFDGRRNPQLEISHEMISKRNAPFEGGNNEVEQNFIDES